MGKDLSPRAAHEAGARLQKSQLGSTGAHSRECEAAPAQMPKGIDIDSFYTEKLKKLNSK